MSCAFWLFQRFDRSLFLGQKFMQSDGMHRHKGRMIGLPLNEIMMSQDSPRRLDQDVVKREINYVRITNRIDEL